MVELVFLVLTLVALWAIRGSVKEWSAVQADNMGLWSAEKKIEQQESLKDLNVKVTSLKEKNGQWFTLDQIRDEMK